MKYKPFIFTRVKALCLIISAAAVFAGLRVSAVAQPAQSAVAAADPPESSLTAGGDLLDQVRDKLKGVSSLHCEIHQTAIFSGMKFEASGRYVQSTGNRFRLDYRISPVVSAKAADSITVASLTEPGGRVSGDGPGQLTQVSNGNTLFTYWKNGPEAQVTRRNIGDILKAAVEVAAYDSSRVIQDLGLGGISALLARIQNTMDLSRVKTETVGDMEFQVVTGRWNSTIRQRMFQLPDDAEVIPQEFIPEFVRIYIDSHSLLPRRIQYLKHFPDPSQKQWRPLVTIDLRQIVLNDTVDDALFSFTAPEGVAEEDITEITVQGIRQSAVTKEAAPVPE